MIARLAMVGVFLIGINNSTAEICNEAISLRINNEGLNFLAQEIIPLIPSKIEFSSLDEVVVDWPLTDDDAVLIIDAPTVDLTIHDFQLLMDDDAVRLIARADLSNQSPFLVRNPYWGFGSAQCVADINIRDLTIDLRLKFHTEAGHVRAEVSRALIDLDQDETQLDLNDCALGEIVATVISFITDHFKKEAQLAVELIAMKKIPQLIATQMESALAMSREVSEFVFTGQLEQLKTDPMGVVVDLGADIELAQPGMPPCLADITPPPPPSCVSPKIELQPYEGMFGVGLTSGIINRGLYYLWTSGRLCINSKEMNLVPLNQGLNELSTTLGLSEDIDLEFAFRLLTPPRLDFLEGGIARIQLNSLALKLSFTPSEGIAGEVGVVADLTVALTPWINPADNTIAVDLKQISITRLNITGINGKPAPLEIDPARMQRFISTVVIPMLNQRLSASALSPAVLNVQDYLIDLKRVHLAKGTISANIDAFHPLPSNDTTPPTTTIIDSPGEIVGPQVIRIQVAGNDNETPDPFLRYQARVDDGEWSEPKFGGRIDLLTPGGRHTVEIVAVDLQGNVDPNPVTRTFSVDDVAPELQITSRCESLLDIGSAEVAFQGSDDRTAVQNLKYSVQLLRLPSEGGSPEIIREIQLSPGARQARLDNLEDGVYKMRVIIEDEAGNVTSEDTGFVVTNQGGCNMGQTAVAPSMVTFSLFFLLILIRRLRRS